jgi:hypothetical protein
MELIQIKQFRVPTKKLRTILWILFPVLIIISTISASVESVPAAIGLVLLFLTAVNLVILYIIADKYFNWPLIFFFIFFTGIYFKRQHWPMATLLGSVAVFMISIVSLANSIRFLVTLRKNSFLKWFGSISGLIITLYMIGWIFLLQGWSRNIGEIFAYSGAVLFIISILGMVFSLPGSDYISWTDIERRSFFRAVLVPMVIVFALIILTFVFEDGYRILLNSDTPRWHINGLKLLELEGIPKI